MANDNEKRQPERQPTTPGSLPATPAAMALHKNFCNAVAGLKRDLVRSIYYLRTIYDRNVYRALGYSNIRRYAAEVAGLNEQQCKAFLKIGARLSELPLMETALADGSLSWRKAQRIVGAASAEREAELIDLAKQLTDRELKRTHRAAPVCRPGPIAEEPAPRDNTHKEPRVRLVPPKTEPKPLPANTPCYVSYRFTPEQYEVWSRLNAAHSARSRGVTKEQIVLDCLAGGEPARSNAGGPDYLVVLHECPTCGAAKLQNSRGTFEAPKALLETAHCDAMIEKADATRRQTIPPRLRRAVLRRDGYRCQAPNCKNTQFLQIHHRVPAAHGGRSTLDNLVTLCARCHRTLHAEENTLRKLNRDPTE